MARLLQLNFALWLKKKSDFLDYITAAALRFRYPIARNVVAIYYRLKDGFVALLSARLQRCRPLVIGRSSLAIPSTFSKANWDAFGVHGCFRGAHRHRDFARRE